MTVRPLEMDWKVVSPILQVLVLGGTLLWSVGELRGDIRVIQTDMNYLKQSVAKVESKVDNVRNAQ